MIIYKKKQPVSDKYLSRRLYRLIDLLWIFNSIFRKTFFAIKIEFIISSFSYHLRKFGRSLRAKLPLNDKIRLSHFCQPTWENATLGVYILRRGGNSRCWLGQVPGPLRVSPSRGRPVQRRQNPRRPNWTVQTTRQNPRWYPIRNEFYIIYDQ